MMSYALVLAVGFVAGTVSGIVGTGATVILLPVLVIVFGPREAVPIMAIVALMSNFAKITSWWREIDWRAVAAYALGGIPAAALGARTLLVLPENTVEVALCASAKSCRPLTMTAVVVRTARGGPVRSMWAR